MKVKILKKVKSLFEIYIEPFDLDVVEQKSILEKFPEPKNLIERSYFQYKCHSAFASSKVLFLKNCIALFALPIFIIIALFNSIFRFRKTQRFKAIFPFKNLINKEILPEAIRSKYDVEEVELYQKGEINFKDLRFLFSLWFRYPFSFFFVLKVLMKIAAYRSMITSYNPDLIIVASEYSFTSSILTQFCHNNDIKHINIMHGEKLFFIRDSFFYFDKCFVWDEYYISLFNKLKAPTNQFEVAFPQYKKIKNIGSEKKFFATYYLGGETEEELQNISKNLKKLGAKRIKIRPHPRYSDVNVLKDIFNDVEIENIQNVNLFDSLRSTEHAISLYSTVLYEAYINGIKVVVDDVSFDVNKLDLLHQMSYLILAKEHILLSNIIKGSTPK